MAKEPQIPEMDDDFIFTNNWFEGAAKATWDYLIPHYKPIRILEIGSYEGASACYLINKLGQNQDIELHCIDTWEGSIEHKIGGTAETDMSQVESRFLHNTRLAIANAEKKISLVLHKGYSDKELAKLYVDGKENYFDFIYIDGSHQAPDVLYDAVLSFKLLKVGGLMAFDDYLWYEQLPGGRDIIRCPKPAIDAFINLNIRKVNIIPAQLTQVYIEKTAN